MSWQQEATAGIMYTRAAVATLPQRGGSGIQHSDGGWMKEGACNQSVMVSLCYEH